MHVKIDYILFRNLMSYSNVDTKFEFKKGLNLISAENGIGKSSIIDALSFNFYGKPYRKIKISELINRTNKKNLYTESQFSVNNDVYKIIRTLKPDSFKIEKNGEDLELLSAKSLTQDELDKILGIDYKMFKNIIALAINYNQPFLSISKQEKREIVEDIFNINIFGKMLKLLKKDLSKLKVDCEIEKSNIEISETTVKTEKIRIDEIKEEKKEFIKNKKTDIDDLNEDIKNKNDAIEVANKKILEIDKELLAIDVVNEKDINELKVKIEDDKKIIEAKVKELKESVSKKENELKEFIKNKEKELIDCEGTFAIEFEKLNHKLDNEYGFINDLNIDDYRNKVKEIEKNVFLNKNDKIKLEQKLKYFQETVMCFECESEISDEKKLLKIKEKTEEIENIIENDKAYKILIDDLNKEIRLGTEKLQLKDDIKCLEKNRDKDIATINEKIKEINNDIVRNNERLDKILLIQNESKVKDYEHEIEKIEQNIKGKELENKKAFEKEKIEQNKVNIENIKKKFDEIESREFTININEIETEFDEKCNEFKLLYKKYKSSLTSLDNKNIVKEILSERGIKSFFFKKLIPVLNQKVNQYLNKFNLPISLSFNDEMVETINTLDGRTSNINYHSFSAGEKKRIDLSILFSFIDTTKIITNWSCNILICDEILDSGVDFDGLEKLIDNLKGLVDNSFNLCVYIISHKLTNDSQFNNVIYVKKENGFSRIEE